ncbi:MAG: OmpA family protein [bacterium]|nr:OmpA family protein [bacterium]
MSRKLFVSCIVVALLAAGATSAAEMGLTAVVFPDGKSIEVPIAGTQRAPAATLECEVEHRAGRSTIEMSYDNLTPAVLFGGDIVSYVAWAVSPDGTVDNLGTLANDGSKKGDVTFSTTKRDFAVMVTAEPIVSVWNPGDLVVFFSGTPAAKKITLTAFTFGGLSDREGLISRDNESIAGMTYKANKKRPLSLIQAEKAFELLERFDAAKHDSPGFEKAMAAITETRELKGGKQVEASKRTVELSGQALRKTASMIEAEERAAKEAEATAQRQALSGKASELEAQLTATKGELDRTKTSLSTTQADLAKTRQQLQSTNRNRAALDASRKELAKQLSGAMGRMASSAVTDRGYVVSLTGTAFGSGKSSLTTDAKYVLAKLSGLLLAAPGAKLAVEGHTDSTGSTEVNHKLSIERAEAVKQFLSEMGVTPGKMQAQGFGPDRPVAPNDTPEGRAKNRRVEIVVIDPS